jgi:acyl-coenzyme A synthetase/AMP-(fatty) acid ligase
MAAALQDAVVSAGEPRMPICLCAENKAVVSAALLAALSSAIPIVVPHACTASALAEARKAIDFRLVVVDGPRSLPHGLIAVTSDPSATHEKGLSRVSTLEPDLPWVYLFTGGSTGKPCLWSKTPRNLLGETRHIIDRFHVSFEDRILATVPVNHIYGLLYAILLPLVSGAAVSMRSPAYPVEILSTLERERTTVLVSIPTHYRALAGQRFGPLGLRHALSSAGPLRPQDDRSFTSKSRVALTEIYGSTETGGIATRCRGQGQPYLVPYSVVDWRIDAERLNIRSAFLSPELGRDAEGFHTVPDRVKAEGDDGFEVAGRNDGIVKVGGKRVDLGRVAQVLEACEGVRDAQVVSAPVDSGRDNVLLAVVEGSVGVEPIEARAIQLLEPHERPRQIKVVAEMPRSRAGKIDHGSIMRLFEM